MSAEIDFLKRKGRKRPDVVVEAEAIDWPIYVPILDEVVVRPMDPPTTSSGGIQLARITKLSDRAMTCVGQIVAIGSQAYTAKTRDGVDFAAEARKPHVGDWVFFTKAAGQPMPVRHSSARDPAEAPRLIWMKDNDIKGVFLNEAEARKVWAWLAA
jgi:co-chaperonin GroES (HSP10)